MSFTPFYNSVRVEVGGHTTVRFFAKRSSAIDAGNGRTKVTNEQHRAVKTTYGYLIKNVVTEKLYDIDGEVPEKAVKEIPLT